MPICFALGKLLGILHEALPEDSVVSGKGNVFGPHRKKQNKKETGATGGSNVAPKVPLSRLHASHYRGALPWPTLFRAPGGREMQFKELIKRKRANRAFGLGWDSKNRSDPIRGQLAFAASHSSPSVIKAGEATGERNPDEELSGHGMVRVCRRLRRTV